MKKIIIALLFFIVSIIQINIAANIQLFGVIPNLYIIFIVCFALLREEYEGAFIGLIAGIIQDMASGIYFGRYSLLGMYLGITIVFFKRTFFKDNVYVAMAFVFLGTIVYEFTLYFFSIFILNQSTILYALCKIILVEAVYNLLLTLLVFPIVELINDWLEESL